MDFNFSGNKDADLIILSKLDDNSLINVCLVNKYANKLCNYDYFWRNRLEEKFGEKALKLKTEDKSWRKLYLFFIYYISKLKEEFNYEYIHMDDETPMSIYFKLGSLIDEEIIYLMKRTAWPRVLDISRIRNDGTNIRAIQRPGETSLKKQISHYHIYSDNIEAVKTLQELVGNYGLIKLWR